MRDSYRVVALVDYNPSLGMIEYIDPERQLVRFLTRVRSELAHFVNMPVTQAECENEALLATTLKEYMMELAETRAFAVRMPEQVPLEQLLKSLRDEYRRWDFKSSYDSGNSSDDWLYQAIEPFKNLYESYVDDNADPAILIAYMVELLAKDMAHHVCQEFAEPLRLFTRMHTHQVKKGSPFNLLLSTEKALGGGQGYFLTIKLKEK